ncbi:MAG TPA: putative sugar nucleotidyl transferase, partial [Tepidisphaeraceae bacterium]|nr:putative sugar nucleotidyl transferase [Tepidisphaeraceae bacterium]
MHVVIFEGQRWHTFAPLSLSRPVFMLKTGMGTLLDKQIRHLRPTRLTLWVRPEQESFVRERVVPKLPVPAAVNKPLDDEPALLVSGRTVHFAQYEYPPDVGVATDGAGTHVRTA